MEGGREWKYFQNSVSREVNINDRISESRMKIRSNPPEVFLEKGILKICSKFTEEHPCQSVVSIKLLRSFFEITLRRGCSPVNLLHILRTPFQEHLRRAASGRYVHIHFSIMIILLNQS